MYRRLLSFGKEPPEFVAGADYVRLILRNGTFDQSFALFVANYQQKLEELSLDELIVLSNLRRKRDISSEEAAKICQRTPREALEVLNRMADKGFLEKVGRKRGLAFFLSKNLYKELGVSTSYIKDKGIDAIRHQHMVLEYVEKYGAIANKDCRKLCGITRIQAYRLLSKLVDQEKIKAVGNKPRAWYEPVGKQK